MHAVRRFFCMVHGASCKLHVWEAATLPPSSLNTQRLDLARFAVCACGPHAATLSLGGSGSGQPATTHQAHHAAAALSPRRVRVFWCLLKAQAACPTGGGGGRLRVLLDPCFPGIQMPPSRRPNALQSHTALSNLTEEGPRGHEAAAAHCVCAFTPAPLIPHLAPRAAQTTPQPPSVLLLAACLASWDVWPRPRL